MKIVKIVVVVKKIVKKIVKSKTPDLGNNQCHLNHFISKEAVNRNFL